MPKFLMQISAFFQNDKPSGIGVTLTEDIGDLDFLMTTVQNAYNMMWTEAEGSLPALIQELRVQLAAIAMSSQEVNLSLASMVIGNIYLLEQRRQMISDEFNGLQLAYVEKPPRQ